MDMVSVVDPETPAANVDEWQQKGVIAVGRPAGAVLTDRRLSEAIRIPTRAEKEECFKSRRGRWIDHQSTGAIHRSVSILLGVGRHDKTMA
jgi:hypothetical protein